MLNVSGTIMVTKRSTLVLCRHYYLTEQFDDILWVQQKYITAEEEWICEEVAKYSVTIKGMTGDVGTSLGNSGVNESVFIAMQKDNLK